MARLIGFTGVKGSGKDTAAQFLVDRGFQRIAFAGKLKEAVANLFGLPTERIDPLKEMSIVSGLPVCEVILQQYNITEYAYSMREFLQRFGTEMGRNTFGQDFWIDLVLSDFPRQDTVFTDVRFDNEATRIIRFGGCVYEIVRPGYESDGHASEEPIDRNLIEGTIQNDGSIEIFRERILDECL